MKKLITILVLLPLLLSSCATVINKKQQKLDVFADKKGAKATINDSTYTLPATVKVTRSKEDLKVTLITDSITKNYIVKASPNASFIYGNLMWMQASPLAYLADFNSPKRFYYGHKIMLSDSDTVNVIVPRLARGYINYFNKRYPTKKGQVNVTGGIPFANLFYFTPSNEELQNMSGFFGVTVGLEYFYKENKFLKLSGSYALDHEVPIPVGIDYDDAHQRVRAANITLTDNYKLNRFTVGYGLNYAMYTWQLINDDYPVALTPDSVTDSNDLRPPMEKNSHAFGLSLNTYHQITKGLFAGIIYNPTLLTTYPNTKWEYGHVVSLEIIYKIRL